MPAALVAPVRMGALYGAALLLGACANDGGPGRCFESGASSYAFHAPGDTTAWFHWTGGDYPVRVYAEPVGSLEANTDAAIGMWLSAFRCGELAMGRWSDSATADIIVRNPAGPPPVSPSARSLAADTVHACRGRTDFALDTLGRIERPVRAHVWPLGIDSTSTVACYGIVVAHELGHALGLFQHSLDSADIMNSLPRRREVSVNDRYTIQILYHRTPTLPAAPR